VGSVLVHIDLEACFTETFCLGIGHFLDVSIPVHDG
jgi:hypothetical protein